MMKSLALLLVLTAGVAACHRGEHNWKSEEAMARMDSLKNELLKTDIAFSDMSKANGRNAAFASYARRNATMLRPYGMPVVGKDSILSFMKEHSDTSYTLTWMPLYADVAHSGELGYTYGTYQLTTNRNGKEEGTYCTVWKKNKEHQWKFVLDTGNEGLKPGDKQ